MPKDTKSLTDAMTDALRGQSRLLENALGKSGPVSLTFDEFCILLPERMTRVNSNAQLADWFTLVDRDNDGAATLYEFFLWALGVASGASASLADSSTGSGASAATSDMERFRSVSLPHALCETPRRSLIRHGSHRIHRMHTHSVVLHAKYTDIAANE